MIRNTKQATRTPTPTVAAAVAQQPPPDWMAQFAQMMSRAPQAAPVYQPVPVLPPSLAPEEIASFDTMLNRLNSTYANQMAQNSYQQGNLNIDRGIQMADLERRFDTLRDKIPGGFQKRGLMNSGIYKNALSEYGTDRTNATTDATLRYQRALSGLQHQAGMYESNLTQGTAENKAMRQARLAGKAAAIRAVL